MSQTSLKPELQNEEDYGWLVGQSVAAWRYGFVMRMPNGVELDINQAYVKRYVRYGAWWAVKINKKSLKNTKRNIGKNISFLPRERDAVATMKRCATCQ